MIIKSNSVGMINKSYTSKKIYMKRMDFLNSEFYMSFYYVYILETIIKGGKKRFYTGYTKNLQSRLSEHKNGTGAKFCRGKDITLKYFETFTNRKDAMKRELEIKSLPRKHKIRLIKSLSH